MEGSPGGVASLAPLFGSGSAQRCVAQAESWTCNEVLREAAQGSATIAASFAAEPQGVAGRRSMARTGGLARIA